MRRFIGLGLQLAKSATAKNLYWMFSGNGIAIIMAVAATSLIGRTGPAQLGLFLALFSLASLVADFSEIGLGSALSSFIPPLLTQNKIKEINTVFSTAFYSQLVIGLVVTAILLLIAPFLSQWIFDETAVNNLFITGLLIISLLFFNFGTFALSSLKKFQENALMNIFAGIVRLILLIIFTWYQQINLSNILWIQLISLFAGFLYSLIFLGPNFLWILPKKTYAKKLFFFSGPLGLQKVFVAVSSRLDILMLTSMVGAYQAGIYGAALRFAQIYPYAVTSFAQVLAPTFAGFATIGDSVKFLKRSLLISGLFLISMILLYIFAQPIIAIPFGHQYDASIPVFRALLLAMIGFVIAVPFNAFITYSLKKPSIIAIGAFLQLIIIFIGNNIFIPRFNEFGPIIGIGVGNIIILFISIVFSWHYYKKNV